MEEIVNKVKRRGRPFGYRLSEETKDKIRQGRLGISHSQETKDKISKSLSEFFKSRESLSDSIGNEYIYISEDAARWVYNNGPGLDEENLNIITEKRLSYLRQLEISLGSEIEQLFGHNSNPEFLMILKEELLSLNDSEILKEFNSLL